MREAAERLLDLGFSDKEASVYLAMLELGPSTVQTIAKKAGVNRTTTYLLIESLKKRGLASNSSQDKKNMFIAESPVRLQELLRRERDELEIKKRRLEDVIPCFMAVYNAMDDKPAVRFYEGEDGIAAVRDALQRATGEYLSFTAIDEGTERISKINEAQRLRMCRRMRGKFIFTLKPGCAMPMVDLRNWDTRELSFNDFSFTGEINIVGDIVAAYVCRGRPLAFLVESREMANLFRAMFMAAWRVAKPVDKMRFH